MQLKSPQYTLHYIHVFYHPPDMRLMPGDELRLRYVGTLRSTWEGVGHVTKVPNSILTWLMCAHNVPNTLFPAIVKPLIVQRNKCTYTNHQGLKKLRVIKKLRKKIRAQLKFEPRD